MAIMTFNTGKVGPRHRGFYSSTEQYVFLDTVIGADESLYINISNMPTPIGIGPENASYWMLYMPNVSTSVGTIIENLGNRTTDLEHRTNDLENDVALISTPPTVLSLVPYLVNAVPQMAERNFFYKTITGITFCHFNLNATDLANQAVLFTMPAGYRPYEFHYLRNATQPNTIGMNPNGNVYFSGAAPAAGTSGSFVYYAFR